jgi:hypothetical protein
MFRTASTTYRATMRAHPLNGGIENTHHLFICSKSHATFTCPSTFLKDSFCTTKLSSLASQFEHALPRSTSEAGSHRELDLTPNNLSLYDHCKSSYDSVPTTLAQSLAPHITTYHANLHINQEQSACNSLVQHHIVTTPETWLPSLNQENNNGDGKVWFGNAVRSPLLVSHDCTRCVRQLLTLYLYSKPCSMTPWCPTE